MPAIAETFRDEDTDVLVEILSVSPTGLCKVKLVDGDAVFARHKDRLRPMNEEAKIMLRGNIR